MPIELLEDLTPPQREAVTHIDGPLLVVAGAGSGKTRVITRRVAHLIASGIAPWHILAITFTNKAAGEMKERIERLLDRRGVWVSTFHSMCARMLRQYPGMHGIDVNFTIADSDDQVAYVKEAMSRLQLDPKNFQPGGFASAISQAKNRMLSPEEFAKSAFDFFDKTVASVYRLYQELLTASHTLDFDDLLMKAALLLREDKEFLQYWTDRFHYILIDEYQDTNHAQYLIANALASARRNLCATGDPDQAIYGWRGADISNILDFKSDYPDAKVVRLEQNYRSTKTILKAADAVIVNNTQRVERGLWTENPTGDPIRILPCRDENQEAAALAAEVRRLRDDGVPLGDVAVFYRTNAQSRVLEKALMNAAVPYMILDAAAFYSRKEIKDVLSYLRLCVNPADELGLARIINVPARGISAPTVQTLKAWAVEKQAALSESLAQADQIETLTPKVKASLQSFRSMMEKLREQPTFPVSEFIVKLLAITDYRSLLDKKGEEARKENVGELVNAAKEYEKQNPEGSLGGFLEQAALVADVDKAAEQNDLLTLMTLHSAKGLEFPVVFITGVEQDLLPHGISKEEHEIEEERRLFYVGVTRTKQRLILLFADQRMQWGSTKLHGPSKFLDEIPRDCCQWSRADVDDWGLFETPKPSKPSWSKKKEDEFDVESEETEPEEKAAPSRGRTIELDPEELATGRGLRCGDRVVHSKFGVGCIMELGGPANERRAVISFERVGTKTLVLKYAKLEKVAE